MYHIVVYVLNYFTLYKLDMKSRKVIKETEQ